MPFDRMAKWGLVKTHLADPTRERGGRSKRIERAAWEGLPEPLPERE